MHLLLYRQPGRVENGQADVGHGLPPHPVVPHAEVEAAVVPLHGVDDQGGAHQDGVPGGEEVVLLGPADGWLGVTGGLALQGQGGALPHHVLARLGEGSDPGRDEDTEAAGLLDGVGVGLHLADVVALVLHHHPPDGEVVARQPEPGVLPDDIPSGTEQEGQSGVPGGSNNMIIVT